MLRVCVCGLKHTRSCFQESTDPVIGAAEREREEEEEGESEEEEEEERRLKEALAGASPGPPPHTPPATISHMNLVKPGSVPETFPSRESLLTSSLDSGSQAPPPASVGGTPPLALRRTASERRSSPQPQSLALASNPPIWMAMVRH